MINWQESSLADEKSEDQFSRNSGDSNHSTQKENDLESIRIIQIENYSDPVKDVKRQEILHKVAVFGGYLLGNQYEEIVSYLFSEDCRVFHFDTKEETTVKHSFLRQGQLDIIQGRIIQERRVQETNVDTSKNTAFQISSCTTLYKNKDKPIEEVSLEIFTINSNNKIVKYILVTTGLLSCHDSKNLLDIGPKEMLRAKIKAVNFTLTGKPDFEKMTTFFHESVEYKIWTWDTEKCYIFGKQDFAIHYQALEENMKINSIIPFQIHSENDATLAVGVYVYYLEDRKSKEKFIWISTITYILDQTLSIIKVSQRGELFPEAEASIPFEVISKYDLAEKMKISHKDVKPSLDLWYSGLVDYSCKVHIFGPEKCPYVGYLKGLDSIQGLLKKEGDDIGIKWSKLIDVFIDFQDITSNVCFTVCCDEVDVDNDDWKWCNKKPILLSFSKIHFEESKVVRVTKFETYLSEPISSPFDNKDFTCDWILPE